MVDHVAFDSGARGVVEWPDDGVLVAASIDALGPEHRDLSGLRAPDLHAVDAETEKYERDPAKKTTVTVAISCSVKPDLGDE
jgi:hypothetical protein